MLAAQTNNDRRQEYGHSVMRVVDFQCVLNSDNAVMLLEWPYHAENTRKKKEFCISCVTGCEK